MHIELYIASLNGRLWQTETQKNCGRANECPQMRSLLVWLHTTMAPRTHPKEFSKLSSIHIISFSYDTDKS